MKIWNGILGLGLVALTANAEVELKGTAGELASSLNAVPGQVRLTASAEVTAESDRAVVRLAIATKDKSLQKTFEKNRVIRDEIVQALTGQGFAKDAVKVSRFSTTPQFGWFSKKPDAYDVTSSVEIFVRNETELQTVTAFVDTKPEVTMQSMTFEHMDKDSYRQKALNQALDKINAQKKVFEEKLGVTLRARSITNGDLPQLSQVGDLGGRYSVGATAGLARKSAADASSDGIGEVTNISQFERITYTANLSLVFDVLTRDAGK